MITLTVEVEGLREALESWTAMERRSRDLLPAWDRVHEAFMEARALAFGTQGSSQGTPWAPLKASTQRRGGKPILQQSERLKRSLTTPTHPEHVWMANGQEILALGSSVPYARFHQAGHSRMVARPPVAPSDAEWGSYRDIVLDWIMEGHRA